MPDPARGQIYDQVTRIVAVVAGRPTADLAGEMELIMDLGLDSLAIFEIVIELEEAYGLKISDADADKIKTIDDAVNYIVQVLPGSFKI